MDVVKSCICAGLAGKLNQSKEAIELMFRTAIRYQFRKPDTGVLVYTQSVKLGLEQLLYNRIMSDGHVIINGFKFDKLEDSDAPYGHQG